MRAFAGLLLLISYGDTCHDAVTSVAAGRVGDIIGRKGTLFIGAIVFTLGGAVQSFTLGFWTMMVGRTISGFGVGLLS